MNSNYDMDSLFAPKIEIKDVTSSRKEGEYSPSADKGQNGVYKSIIRFVTWWKDPNNSYKDKWVSWLVDPVTNRGRSIDCPSSVGKPSPLQDMFFKLRGSESIQEQKKAEIFSRRHQYFALIQVIKDDQNKELEGKLLVYQFGKKVFEKYEAEKKPLIGDPHEPFDLLDGKAFALVITKVSGYNNYDQSKFINEKIPLLLPVNAQGQVVPFGTQGLKLQPINDRTPREVVFNFLKENSPDLDKYGYTDWDQDTHEYVNNVILNVTGITPSSGFAAARNAQNAPSSAPHASPQSPQSSAGITSTEISIDDLGADMSAPSSYVDSLPDLNLPDIESNDNFGLTGNLDDIMSNL